MMVPFSNICVYIGWNLVKLNIPACSSVYSQHIQKKNKKQKNSHKVIASFGLFQLLVMQWWPFSLFLLWPVSCDSCSSGWFAICLSKSGHSNIFFGNYTRNKEAKSRTEVSDVKVNLILLWMDSCTVNPIDTEKSPIASWQDQLLILICYVTHNGSFVLFWEKSESDSVLSLQP